ncbi:MAG: TPR end-of-group domain-containing protein [Solirubrobacteraceae bacterium]
MPCVAGWRHAGRLRRPVREPSSTGATRRRLTASHHGLPRAAVRRRAQSGPRCPRTLPYHAGLHYNYACLATLAGDTSDDTFVHLRRSVELLPRFREDARRDDDLAGIRNEPRFEQALR